MPQSGLPRLTESPLQHAHCLARGQDACRDGEAAGLEEGRELGESKGHEIGAEVGFYAGFSEVPWIQLYSPAAQH